MCTSGMPNTALSAATRMSQLAATSRPAPRQKPLMRPITGTGHLRIALQAWCSRVMNSRALSAQKAPQLVEIGPADERALARARQHHGAQGLIVGQLLERLSRSLDDQRRRVRQLSRRWLSTVTCATRPPPLRSSAFTCTAASDMLGSFRLLQSMADPPMPLQNRVTPEGDIIATPASRPLMGNRGGAFHLPDKRSARAAGDQAVDLPACWSSRAGTARSCSPTAIPSCFFSTRRPRSRPDIAPASNAAAPTRSASRKPGVRDMGCRCGRARRTWTRCCIPQRIGKEQSRVRGCEALAGLPDGVFVRWRHAALSCCRRPPSGVDARGLHGPVSPATHEVEVLTPPSIVAVLSAGYRPMLHPSAAALLATAWDGSA